MKCWHISLKFTSYPPKLEPIIIIFMLNKYFSQSTGRQDQKGAVVYETNENVRDIAANCV